MNINVSEYGQIEYVVTSGAGPTVIFVHGAGGSVHSWIAQQRGLGAKYKTVALDLPGHGKSQGKLLETTEQMANFLRDFADALSIQSFILAGHSMGGAVAIEVALKFPGRIQGLILIATGARLRVSPIILEKLGQGEQPYSSAHGLYAPGTPPEILALALQDLNQVPSEVYLADFNACNQFDRISEIGEIGVPTLILVGSQDVMTAPKYSQYLREHLAHSQLRIIDNAGHMCMVEKSQEVNAAILEFLATLND